MSEHHPDQRAVASKVRNPRRQRPPAAAHQVAPHESMGRETRKQKIAEAAYYLAERRGFEAGFDLQDWSQAEDQIDAAGPWS